MTLDAQQLRRTSEEHRANLALTGLTRDEVAADLGWAASRLDSALAPDGARDPVDSWELRDYLVRTVRDAGRAPVPFTVLTPANRLRARMWFGLRTAPRHDFSDARPAAAAPTSPSARP